MKVRRPFWPKSYERITKETINSWTQGHQETMRIKTNSTDLHGHKENKAAKGDSDVSSAKSSAFIHQVGRRPVSQGFTAIQPWLPFLLKCSLEFLFFFTISIALCFLLNEMNNDEELWNLIVLLYFSWHINLKSV